VGNDDELEREETGWRAATYALSWCEANSQREDATGQYTAQRVLAARPVFLARLAGGTPVRPGWFVWVQEKLEPPPSDLVRSFWELVVIGESGGFQVIDERRLPAPFEEQRATAREVQRLVAGDQIDDEATRFVLRAVLPPIPVDSPATLAHFTQSLDALASFNRGRNAWLAYLVARMKFATGDLKGVAYSLQTAADKTWLLKSAADRRLLKTLVGATRDELGQFREEERQWLTAYQHTRGQALPEMRTLPGSRTVYFTGRDATLLEIRQQLCHSYHICVLRGMAGVGKTQLALEYVHRYYAEYDYLFWVSASSPDEPARTFDRIAESIPAIRRHRGNMPELRRALGRWMERHTRWLLVIDDADEQDLREFLPTTMECGHILVTTRNHRMALPGPTLDPLPPDEAATLLLRRSRLIPPDATPEGATALLGERDWQLALERADQVGGNPLALDQLGAWMAERSSTLADLRALSAAGMAQLLRARGSNPFGHPDTILASIEQDVRLLAQRNAAAADLLALCAVLADAPVPESFVRGGAAVAIKSLAAAKNLGVFDAMVGDLHAHFLASWAHQDPYAFAIHPMVRSAVLANLSASESASWHRLAVLSLYHELERTGAGSPLEVELQPHVLYGLQLLEEQGLDVPELATVSDRFRRALVRFSK
jgi:hypothetical protein